MTPLRAELWFLWRDRAALLWFAIALFTSGMSVAAGVWEMRAQRSHIERLVGADADARRLATDKQSDWGGLAYHSFHLSYDPPSRLAFAAVGQRDVAPWKHRIRMLALEGQIYEADLAPPTQALIGRLDFAFVASLLAPLFVIFLLHDLRTRERSGGRFEMLVVTAGCSRRLWLRRAGLRIAGLLLCVLSPFAIGAVVEHTPITGVLAVSLALCAQLAFWCWLAELVGRRARSSAVSLVTLVGIWLGLAVVAPPVLRVAVDRAIPVSRGSEILLSQREAVNEAWDLPKATTMTRFVDSHPQWRDHAGVQRPFEWKWFFAFQQVGDESVAELSRRYRDARAERDAIAGWFAYLSPPALLERTLQRLAETDVPAALRYEQSVREFHAALRAYYYPKLFEAQPFDPSAISKRPEYEASTSR